MKKLILLLLTATIFLSVDTFAQSSSIVRQDTLVKPVSTRLGYNKLDYQIIMWDKVSWKNVPLTLRDTATLDFASSGATTVSDLTVTITGAKLGDEVAIGVPHGSVTATGSYYGWVSAANTVTIRFSPKATENPASGVFHVSVLKYYKWR